MHIYNNRWPFLLVWLSLGLLLGSCGSNTGVRTIFQKRTPHEAYAEGLRTAGLHRSALGQAWFAASQQALRDSLLVTLPFRETGYFRAEKPMAAAYSFHARRGQMVSVRVTTDQKQDLRLFLDLYEVGKARPREVRHLAAADTTQLLLEQRLEEDLTLLVRLQPELLKSGRYTITIQAKASLAFPVQGKDSRAVQSFWGAARDGGARRHEGVDIFAPRGTPVVATSRGTVTRVQETPIGGKVVWLADAQARQHIYFAHLDKQLVHEGQQVQAGDTLGLVGNTGNAKGTVPHLHFGIYTFGGAVDPYPYIHQPRQTPAPLRVNETYLGQWARVKKGKATLYHAPEKKARVVMALPRHTALQVLGGTGEWFRVQLPDNAVGYLHEDYLERAMNPVSVQTLKADAEVTDQPLALGAPVAQVKKEARVAILGLYQMHQLVRLADGTLGWLRQ